MTKEELLRFVRESWNIDSSDEIGLFHLKGEPIKCYFCESSKDLLAYGSYDGDRYLCPNCLLDATAIALDNSINRAKSLAKDHYAINKELGFMYLYEEIINDLRRK